MNPRHFLSLAAVTVVLVIGPMQASAQDRYGAWRDESGDLPGFSSTPVLLIGVAVVAGGYLVWRLVRSDPSEADANEAASGQVFQSPVGATSSWPTTVRTPDISLPDAGAVRAAAEDCGQQPRECLRLSGPLPIVTPFATR